MSDDDPLALLKAEKLVSFGEAGDLERKAAADYVSVTDPSSRLLLAIIHRLARTVRELARE